jgi:hypothetical protein
MKNQDKDNCAIVTQRKKTRLHSGLSAMLSMLNTSIKFSLQM